MAERHQEAPPDLVMDDSAIAVAMAWAEEATDDSGYALDGFVVPDDEVEFAWVPTPRRPARAPPEPAAVGRRRLRVHRSGARARGAGPVRAEQTDGSDNELILSPALQRRPRRRRHRATAAVAEPSHVAANSEDDGMMLTQLAGEARARMTSMQRCASAPAAGSATPRDGRRSASVVDGTGVSDSSSSGRGAEPRGDEEGAQQKRRRVDTARVADVVPAATTSPPRGRLAEDADARGAREVPTPAPASSGGLTCAHLLRARRRLWRSMAKRAERFATSAQVRPVLRSSSAGAVGAGPGPWRGVHS